jgi:hypothetical protein
MHGDMERLLYQVRVDVVFVCHTHAYEQFLSASRLPLSDTFHSPGRHAQPKDIYDHE